MLLMRRRFEMIWMVAAVAIAARVSGNAQVPAPPSSAPQSIHAGPVYTSLTDFPEVRVLVDVPPGTAKESLLPESFSLHVDNAPSSPGTKVQTLADAGLGMAAVVMLDVSGSMIGGPLNAIRAGLIKFASQVGAQDRASIATIADDTKWETTWTDSPDAVRMALAGLKSRGTLTRLWDGLVEATGSYPETPLARRLVVISDGHDEGSKHPLDDVIAAALKQHIAIDSIGLTRSDPKFLENLARLSGATGGLYRVAQTLTILEKLVGDGIERYRAMPVVTFHAAGVTADGKVHPFDVTWKGGGGEFQALFESQLPEDPKLVAAVAQTDPQKDATPAPAAPASQMDQIRQKLQQVPQMYWMIGGGVAGALLLGLILFLVLRKGKKGKPQAGKTPPRPQQGPPFQQPQFQQGPPQYQQGPPQFQQGPPPQYPPQGYQQQQPFFEPQPPPMQPPYQQPFQQQPGPLQPPPGPMLATGSFGQTPPPQQPQQPPPHLFNAGSVYQPLPPQPQGPAAPPPGPIPVQEPIPTRASESRFQTPSKGNPSAWLVCTEGPSAGRSFPIDEAQFWIGASANNHLQLGDDPTVSGNHACIAYEQDTLGIYDHHSTNGLFLNDDRVTDVRRVLKPGDRVRIGRSTFVLQPASSGNRPA